MRLLWSSTSACEFATFCFSGEKKIRIGVQDVLNGLRANARTLVFFVAGALAVCSSAAQENNSAQFALGKSLFEGSYNSQNATAALPDLDIEVPAEIFPCASCHGMDTAGGSSAPNISVSQLLARQSMAEGDQKSCLSDLFQRATTQGVGIDGDVLEPRMPRFTFDAAEIEARRLAYHAPYHAALAAALERAKAQHGFAILYDCHSIRSTIPFLFDGTLPDFNTGTNMGTTCDPAIEDIVVTACAAAEGYSSVLNGRFKGGWTTRHYGHPEEGLHAIQMAADLN